MSLDLAGISSRARNPSFQHPSDIAERPVQQVACRMPNVSGGQQNAGYLRPVFDLTRSQSVSQSGSRAGQFCFPSYDADGSLSFCCKGGSAFWDCESAQSYASSATGRPRNCPRESPTSASASIPIFECVWRVAS
ncbi:hypothetical protein AXG93_4491s1020 [Marchantia polymorpha subsp. ruderalis]|uniref:Uncharacterized protein n=1 Tax=Marchantia polymorpha subsp. ruderalis TaxID=1480154 RepID=A0A176WSR6_MARPO|nr:hypothetical protein AXG93_4491s1020 [Marchantia polymorpha subsp. ruderalis]